MPKIVNHEERRAAIAGVAARMIADVGLERTTIREIARESGFSKGIIEHYFDSKEDLINSALDWVNRRYLERVQDVSSQARGIAAIQLKIRSILPFTDDMREEWKIRIRVWGLAAIDDKFRKLQAKRFDIAANFFRLDVMEAQRLGEVPSSKDALAEAEWLLHQTSGVGVAATHNPERFDEGYMEQAIGRIVATLKKP